MDDPAIVELYWQRSDRAIPETAAKYGAYCRSIACNILQNPEDTEECLNDTWLRAWNAMPDQRPAQLKPFSPHSVLTSARCFLRATTSAIRCRPWPNATASG